jgi:hypothetical protein
MPVVGVRLGITDAEGKSILPALISDGYFTLLPGETRELTIDGPPALTPIRIRTEAYNSKPRSHDLK